MRVPAVLLGHLDHDCPRCFLPCEKVSPPPRKIYASSGGLLVAPIKMPHLFYSFFVVFIFFICMTELEMAFVCGVQWKSVSWPKKCHAAGCDCVWRSCCYTDTDRAGSGRSLGGGRLGDGRWSVRSSPQLHAAETAKFLRIHRCCWPCAIQSQELHYRRVGDVCIALLVTHLYGCRWSVVCRLSRSHISKIKQDRALVTACPGGAVA